ncbi:MAG TPA: GMC family oxidoreductase [Polyangiales bacterium]
MNARAQDIADYVIVGTGAGGATAARVLSAAGASVILVEEGPALAPEQRSAGLLDAMSESVRDLATVTTNSPAPLPLLLGRCVGGSTAINSGIIWRLPEKVRALWASQYGLHELVDAAALDRIFTTLEAELGVAEVPDDTLGGNGLAMRRASEVLGLPGRSIRRNAKTCVGNARCLQGCPEGARQSMDVSYIPAAQRNGAQLLALARATKVLMNGERAVGVDGRTLDPETRKPIGRFTLHARRGVIVAASAIHTPLLLWASGVRRNVGDGYQAHPGAAVVGRFDRAIGMGSGATQSYEVPLPELGVKLESIALPPELLAARLPGAGAQWQRELSRLDHFAQFCAVVRMGARGRIRPGLFGGPDVRYEPLTDDVRRLKEGVALLVRMMFAAGAVEVYPGVHSVPERLTHPEQAELLTSEHLTRRDFHMMASHHFATAAAGVDPRSSVVSPELLVHGTQGLYVMDASVLPTNLGVNPQHTIMAVTWCAAERLANTRRPSLRAA